VTTFYNSNATLPGYREIRAEATVLLAVRAGLAASATPNGGATWLLHLSFISEMKRRRKARRTGT
jgi:hypothetical protein